MAGVGLEMLARCSRRCATHSLITLIAAQFLTHVLTMALDISAHRHPVRCHSLRNQPLTRLPKLCKLRTASIVINHPLQSHLPEEDAEGDCAGSDAAGGCVQDWLGNDSLSSFSWDHPSPVRKQLMDTDPGLNQGLISSAMTITQLFSQDHWEKHRSPSRYATNLINIMNSTVLRRILQPMMGLVLLAIGVTAYNICSPANWVSHL
jgi:hypothetical protein